MRSRPLVLREGIVEGRGKRNFRSARVTEEYLKSEIIGKEIKDRVVTYVFNKKLCVKFVHA